MPNIPYPDINSVPEAMRANFDKMPGLFRLMLHRPEIHAGGMAIGGAVMAKGILPADLREFVILATFRLEGGNYGWVQHIPIAEKAGCSKEQIAAIEAVQFDAPVFNAKEKAALRLTREVVQKVRASDAAMDEAKRHFTPAEIMEIVVAASYYGMNIRIAETFRIEDEPAFKAVATHFKRVE
jgi:alkylhydroperoxidase family enzyme